MALSAAAPIFRGHLADIDARWTVISQSVDDRTDEEKGEKVRLSAEDSRLLFNGDTAFIIVP